MSNNALGAAVIEVVPNLSNLTAEIRKQLSNKRVCTKTSSRSYRLV